MRLTKRTSHQIVEGDMTPMIDMTFQLIAFFMVLINFSEIEQDQRVTLPASELAKPPEMAYEEPITIQLTGDGTVLFGGQDLSLDQLHTMLRRETDLLKAYGDGRLQKATVVIRADEEARTGLVQEIIKVCQELELDTFALRGRQSEKTTLIE